MKQSIVVTTILLLSLNVWLTESGVISCRGDLDCPTSQCCVKDEGINRCEFLGLFGMPCHIPNEILIQQPEHRLSHISFCPCAKGFFCHGNQTSAQERNYGKCTPGSPSEVYFEDVIEKERENEMGKKKQEEAKDKEKEDTEKEEEKKKVESNEEEEDEKKEEESKNEEEEEKKSEKEIKNEDKGKKDDEREENEDKEKKSEEEDKSKEKSEEEEEESKEKSEEEEDKSKGKSEEEGDKSKEKSEEKEDKSKEKSEEKEDKNKEKSVKENEGKDKMREESKGKIEKQRVCCGELNEPYKNFKNSETIVKVSPGRHINIVQYQRRLIIV